MITINVLIVLGSIVVADMEIRERVKGCPQNQTEWIDRSSKFNCTKSDDKYHCLLDSMWKLVEVCIAPLMVKEKEKGCPTAFIFESEPYWMFPFTPCPVQNKECPQEGHKGYSTEQLYKYPACFQNATYRTASDKDVQTTLPMITVDAKRKQTDEFYRSDVNYIPYLLLLIIALIITSYAWNVYIARDLKHKIESATGQGISKSKLDCCFSSDVALQDEENQRSQRFFPKGSKLTDCCYPSNSKGYINPSLITTDTENQRNELKRLSPKESKLTDCCHPSDSNRYVDPSLKTTDTENQRNELKRLSPKESKLNDCCHPSDSNRYIDPSLKTTDPPLSLKEEDVIINMQLVAMRCNDRESET